MRRMGIVMWGLVLLGFLAPGESMRGQTIDVLHNFTGGTGDASRPLAGLAGPDQAGNLYGTTVDGGVYAVGTVFKLDPAGNETVLYNFIGLNGDGANPYAGVVLDDAGNLYGTTSSGGTSYHGTVFKLDPAGNETVLHRFNGSDGSDPQAGLIRDDAGNLYGTTNSTVFKLDPAGNETVYPVGGQPFGGLILDPAGNLYGTTYYGGTNNLGTVFKLDPVGHETVLHSFTGSNGDGAHPQAGLVRDDAGNLYGTTEMGGTSEVGTVFMLDPAGHESVLHSFTCHNGDGCYPRANLIRDDAGNLYGTTYYGDTNSTGIVFRLDPAGNETVLHSFIRGSGDGANPQAGLVRDDAGNLYGTTEHGGENDQGAVFKVDALSQETVLYSFLPLSPDGANPYAGLVLDDAGNLYGTTYDGGTNRWGTLFKVDPDGNETVLHSFAVGNGDGAYPKAGLVFDDAGNLYGTTVIGGIGTSGTVFKLDPAGNETVLYRFTDFNSGFQPWAGLIRDDAGNLYGATAYGSTDRQGTVFKLDPAGNETVLHSFTGFISDGATPVAGLVRDDAGNLYGTTVLGGRYNEGTVFRVDPAGNETVLHSFPSVVGDGVSPYAGLVLDDAGNLYGTTVAGTNNYYGTVFKIDPAGNETVLYRFTGANGDGSTPYAGLIRDAAGNLYGTTYYGGILTAGSPYGLGTVFMLDPAGNETVLYSFTGADNDGANPYAGLVLDDAGNLYGTTLHGGTNGQGIVFRLPHQ